MKLVQSRHLWRIASLIALATATLPAFSGVEPSPAAPQGATVSLPTVSPLGLARVFEPGWFLQDRNGDGQADFVRVRIVLPRPASSEEVAAATAVAARLGLETSGLSFPIVFSSDEALAEGAPAILIGTENQLLPAEVASRARNLEPGQGLVATLGDSIAIAGRDLAGTQAAGEAFAARSPYLWAIVGRENGDTFERIAGQLDSTLSEGGFLTRAISFDEIVYQVQREEAVHVSLSVTLGSGGEEGARERLEELARRHRQGRDVDRLSYASVAELAVSFGAGSDQGEITLPRVGLPQAVINPPRRPPTRFENVRPSGPSARPAAARKFDLGEVFTPETGLLRDRDRDKIADDSDLMIVIPARPLEGQSAILETAQLGARLGLESTGLTFPLLGFDSQLEDPELDRRPLVLIGDDNALVRELGRQGKLRGADLTPGTGRIEVVPEALNESSAVVITGHDSSSEAAAIDYLSRRLPYVWEVARGALEISDVRKSVARLLEGKSTPAQAALAVAEIEELLEDLDDLKLESLTIDGYFESRSEQFEGWLSKVLADRLDVPAIQVMTHGRRDPVEVFSEEPELEWEVDTFWSRFRAAIADRQAKGSVIEVELRVSESPELRAELAKQIREEIAARGFTPAVVKVFSAYKQGLSWLMDDIVPSLRDQPVASIEIAWRPLAVDPSQKHGFYNEPARWLNELYPADDVLADRLGMALDSISFVMEPDLAETYQLTARDVAGRVLLSRSFSPKHYQRPYLEAYPEVASSIVTTGWLSLLVDGEQIVDERIPTDLDRIWDHYQSETLKRVQEHVRSTTGRSPTSEKAPYFHTLKIELEASEPDFRLGIDEEMVTALESLHDSFYFDTLDFFYEMAQSAMERDQVAPRSLAPGNILPWIHPERRGQAPSLHITYSGFASKDPKIVIKYKEAGGQEKTETKLLKPEKEPQPFLFLAEVAEGTEGLARLGFLVTLEDTKLLARLTDLLENLSRLQAAGLFTNAFEVASLDQVAIRIEAPGVTRTRTYAVAGSPAHSTPTPYSPGLVTWDHVISPQESERIAHTLGTLPNITSYVAGESYQGRPVSVMEVRLPMEAELISQAKLSTWKPVLSITGRQHANEVSSTSHILRLAELLATDPEYQGYLKKMNVVIQPVVNPDGAALAFELQKLTPNHCLHAGRYSALGPDVPGQANNRETLVTEALVLSEMSNLWLPDVLLNPHGYPSHEWVQHFANYNPKSFRSYWIPRGWYTSVRIPEHPGLEDARSVSLALRDLIAEEVARDSNARETNLRIYDRYQRWALRWQPHVYNLEIHNDTAIYSSRTGGSEQRPSSGPQTTIFSGYTEAMDETAQGPWLELVTRMGFGYLMAAVRFLDEAEYELFRIEEERAGRVHISVARQRPLKPGPGSQIGSGRR